MIEKNCCFLDVNEASIETQPMDTVLAAHLFFLRFIPIVSIAVVCLDNIKKQRDPTIEEEKDFHVSFKFTIAGWFIATIFANLPYFEDSRMAALCFQAFFVFLLLKCAFDRLSEPSKKLKVDQMEHYECDTNCHDNWCSCL